MQTLTFRAPKAFADKVNAFINSQELKPSKAQLFMVSIERYIDEQEAKKKAEKE